MQVRRAATGLYYVRFPVASQLAMVAANSDNGSLSNSTRDNIVSVAKINACSCPDPFAFRVQIEDVSGTGSGTAPADSYFTIMVR